MLYFKEADILELLPMDECIRMMRHAFSALGEGRAQSQPRRRMMLQTGSGLHSMAGAVGNYFGTKIYSTNPNFGAHFLFVLYDARTATPLAIMEANHLGQIRTGAASGYAADMLADPQAGSLGVIGSGFQAKTQIDAIRSVRSIREIRVWSRDPAKRKQFAQENGAQAVETPEEAVRGARIVVAATSAKDPVFEDGWISPGTHVIGMGSNAANRRELPAELLKRAELVAVDSLEQAKIEAGDLIIPNHWENVVELQTVKQHYDPKAVTVFKSLGVGVEDVAAAAFIYERALTTPERFAGRNLATH